MLHKANKAYYACDVIRSSGSCHSDVTSLPPLFRYSINRLAARTGCAVHAPCLLAIRQLP